MISVHWTMSLAFLCQREAKRLHDGVRKIPDPARRKRQAFDGMGLVDVMTPQGTALMDTCNQQLARNPKNGWVGFPLWESSQQPEGLDQARENPCQDTAFGAKLSYIMPP